MLNSRQESSGDAIRAESLLETLQACALPIVVAPMFLVSNPNLVLAACRARLIGSFPAPNARTIEELEQWLTQIAAGNQGSSAGSQWMLNMIVHSSYDRFDQELELVLKYKPPIVSTALGSPRRVVDHIHSYGGVVVADVTTPTLASKAIDAGVDALVLVTHGAGGHTGTYHPFALLAEVRKFFNGPLGLAGAISSGREILAAQVLGADFAVMGTSFIIANESAASTEYRDLLASSTLSDLVETKAVSGVLANWLKPTLDRAGFTPEMLTQDKRADFSGDIATAPKAWKTVWSAGHGVGAVGHATSLVDIRDQLVREYAAATIRRLPNSSKPPLLAST